MTETYIDSLPTTERAAHSALLERHDSVDFVLASIAVSTVSLNERMARIEASIARLQESRLSRILRRLGLLDTPAITPTRVVPTR
jgi:hypothetical protein